MTAEQKAMELIEELGGRERQLTLLRDVAHGPRGVLYGRRKMPIEEYGYLLDFVMGTEPRPK